MGREARLILVNTIWSELSMVDPPSNMRRVTDATPRPRRNRTRIVLLALIAVAAIVLVLVAAIVLPIFTHQNSGGSGQVASEGFPDSVSADGADGRTRTLSAQTPDGAKVDLSQLSPGDEVLVTGSGFNSANGIYVGFCRIPDSPEVKPSPCLGGIPEDARAEKEHPAAGADAAESVWLTDNWAWRSFATGGFDDGEKGTFTARLVVPEPEANGLDCRAERCGITTRNDHTAAADRVQDLHLAIGFAED